jgi:hypothetical protein
VKPKHGVHDGFCDVTNCKRPAAIIWLDHEVCQMHWEMDCTEDGAFKLKREFGKEAPKGAVQDSPEAKPN